MYGTIESSRRSFGSFNDAGPLKKQQGLQSSPLLSINATKMNSNEPERNKNANIYMCV